jgi:hypothetical protein
MKSKQPRGTQIKARRLERAARLAKDDAARDVGALMAGRPVPGMALADLEVLKRYNHTWSPPRYYLDRAFTCRDCGAEEVWTAKQQKWWYEIVHAPIDSVAVRCRACRRVRRAQLAAHEGADLLGEQTRHLRALGAQAPTTEAQAEVDAALQSKWWGLRVVAIETLGRWGGPQQIAQLEALAATYAGRTYRRGSWERAIADAASTALSRQDKS